MEKIPIKYSDRAKYIRFGNNVINNDNYKIFLKLLTSQQKYVKSYDTIGKERLYNLNRQILDNFYRCIVNTTGMKKLIEEHNQIFSHSKELQELCGSEDVEINTGKTLADSISNDVITTDFKKLEDVFNDEIMQKLAFWANRLSHCCKDEISSFAEQFMGPFYNEDDEINKKKKFVNKISKSTDKFKKDTDRFNQSKVLKLIRREDFNFDTCTDPDFLKVKALMKDEYIKCRGKDDIQNFIYCNKIQIMRDNFFDYKDNAVENLLLYLGDSSIDEEDKNIIAFRIKDPITKAKNTESLSRVVLVNKSMYEQYLKFNDSVCFTNEHIDSIFAEYGISTDKRRRARQKIKEAFSNKVITSNTMAALIEKCSVSVFHVPDKALNKFLDKQDIAINESYPPIINCMANTVNGIYDIVPTQMKEKGLEYYLENQKNLNEKNEERFGDDPDRFYNLNKVGEKARDAIDGKQNPII